MTENTARIVLGAMRFGTDVPEQVATDILDAYVDGGGTVVDTANCYTFWESEDGFGGQSEELLGRWLARRPGLVDRVSLSTKVGAEPTVAGGWPTAREGLSGTAIRAGIEGSLKRLGVDHVDTYWAHMDDRATDQAETVDAFAEVVERGQAKVLGCSNFATWRVERARTLAGDRPRFTALQLRDSYLRPRPDVEVEGQSHRFGWVTEETLDYAETFGLDIWAYTPLLRGAFDRPERLPEPYQHAGTENRLRVLSDVAAEMGVTSSAVVLAWLIGRTPSITPIVGVTSTAQIEAALAAGRLDLSTAQRQRLDAAG
jgi:aryl-alcohol dehydrogenase-like predicted oxidoreductase